MAAQTEQVSYRNPVKATGWAQVYHAITLDDRISHGAYRLLMLYEMHAQQKDLCWPGRERLAKMLKCSERSITRYNSELEIAGYITRQRRMSTSTMTYIEDYEQIPHLRQIAQETLSRRDTSDTTHVTSMSHVTGQECHVKNEQGNNEQVEEKTNTPIGVVSPEHEQKADLELFFGGDVPEMTEKPKQPIPESLDMLEHTVQQAARRERGEIDWLLPGTPCGDHAYLDPLFAFCAVIRRQAGTLGEKTALQWLRRLEHIGTKEDIQVVPSLMVDVIKAMRDDWAFMNDVWLSPYSDKFGEKVRTVADRMMAGVVEASGQAKIVIQDRWAGYD